MLQSSLHELLGQQPRPPLPVWQRLFPCISTPNLCEFFFYNGINLNSTPAASQEGVTYYFFLMWGVVVWKMLSWVKEWIRRSYSLLLLWSASPLEREDLQKTLLLWMCVHVYIHCIYIFIMYILYIYTHTLFCSSVFQDWNHCSALPMPFGICGKSYWWK